MKSVDYIVVGLGLASIAFCEQLKQHNKTFYVFDDASQQASKVAAGLYNPVILKRFTAVWKAEKQLQMLELFYANLERKLGVKLNQKLKIFRRFASIEEQNLWFSAADKKVLETFLSTQLIKNINNYIDAPFGFGEVKQCGWVDTITLIENYKDLLKIENNFTNTTFHYNELEHSANGIKYKTINAKYIVFAEGFGVKKNPFFKTLPLNPAKGEVLTIYAPDLKIDFVIKASVFVIPIGNDLYTVGSTYNWEDKTNTPTEDAKSELVTKLKTLITCNFDIIKHVAGVRPTTKDRRPLVGGHSTLKSTYVLNGLGTRGVMIAPYVAEQLFRHIEYKEALNPELDINRFY